MGLLSRLFGTKSSDPLSGAVTPELRASFEGAAQTVGWHFLRWEGGRACFEARGKQRFAGFDAFLSSLAGEGRAPTRAEVAAYVQKLDSLLATEDARRDEAKNLGLIKQRLRPRLLTPDAVASAPDFPSGAYVDGQLSRALAIDYPDTSTFVNTVLLSAWGVSFEEAWELALENLIATASASEFEPLPDHHDVLVCSTEDQIGSNRVFVLPRLLPQHDPSLGFLFSVPSSDVLLVHIIRGSGSAVLPPIMFALALPLLQSRPRPLNASVFWLRAGKALRLNLTATATHGTPEINFVAGGDTEEFMKAVGSIRIGAV